MTIRECYEIIGGDFEDLMQRIPKEAMVVKFIGKYAESDEFANMIAAYEASDYRRLFEASHNLKGMSANLSLKKINMTITQICEAVRGGEPNTDLAPLIAQAKAEQETLVNAVKQLE